MSTTPNKITIIEKQAYWAVTILLLLIGLLFSLMELSEFYNVALAGQAGAYPFGQVNENQWYYQSADIYWKYALVNGLAFFLATFLTLAFLIKGKRRLTIAGLTIIGLLLLVHFINMASF